MKRHVWEIKNIKWLEDQGRPITIDSIQIVKISQEKGWKQNKGEEIIHWVSQEHLPELEVTTHSKSHHHEIWCNGEIRKILPEEQERAIAGESLITKDTSQVTGFLNGTKEL